MEKSKTLNPQERIRRNLKAFIFGFYDASNFIFGVLIYMAIFYSLLASIIYFYNTNLLNVSLMGISIFKMIICFTIFGIIFHILKIVIVHAEKHREVMKKKRQEFKEQLTKEILKEINGRSSKR